MDFLDDKDKMIDFFNMERKMFLESYSYLSEDDYTTTCRAIGRKVKFNDCTYYNYDSIEGMHLGNLVCAAMIYEWLNIRKHNKEIHNEALDKLDEIITERLDQSDNQVECQTLRWVLDKISELIE